MKDTRLGRYSSAQQLAALITIKFHILLVNTAPYLAALSMVLAIFISKKICSNNGLTLKHCRLSAFSSKSSFPISNPSSVSGILRVVQPEFHQLSEQRERVCCWAEALEESRTLLAFSQQLGKAIKAASL